MKEFLLVAVGFLVGVIFAKYRFGRLSSGDEQTKQENLIAKQAREKEEGLRKIIEFFESREKAANDDIEKLLGVSDATATRYLDELEKTGRIRQVGTAGKHVYYEKTSQ